MSLKAQLEKAFERAFDLPLSLKRINRSEEELRQLRELVDADDSLPRILTDKHVSWITRWNSVDLNRGQSEAELLNLLVAIGFGIPKS